MNLQSETTSMYISFRNATSEVLQIFLTSLKKTITIDVKLDSNLLP